jgi:hypothetical protein
MVSNGMKGLAFSVLDYVRPDAYNTYMSKLTLSVDEHVVRQAKRYAAKRGTSVSHLVERYLSLVARPPRSSEMTPPVLSMLRGAAKGIDAEEYGRHLVRKYR